jgi:hypothetical protein
VKGGGYVGFRKTIKHPLVDYELVYNVPYSVFTFGRIYAPAFLTSPYLPYRVDYKQGCGAGTGTGRNRIHLGTLGPEPYSEYGSGSGYKEMKQKTQKNVLEV